MAAMTRLGGGWCILLLALCTAQRSVEDVACDPPHSTALLLLGAVAGSPVGLADLAQHTRALATNVASPLGARVIAVYEVTACDREHGSRRHPMTEPACAAGLASSARDRERAVAAALRAELGHWLRAEGRMRPAACAPHRDEDGVWVECLEPDPHGAWRSVATSQWLKLREAWRLMEALEAAGDAGAARFELVAKLRFDAVPLPEWRICAARDGLRADAAPAIHAMSDLVFWGARAHVRIASRLYDALCYFEGAEGARARRERAAHGARPQLGAVQRAGDASAAGCVGAVGSALAAHGGPRREPLSRPVSVCAMLASVRALPPAGWRRPRLYSKLGTLPFPRLQPTGGAEPAGEVGGIGRAKGADAAALLEAHLQAARDAGWAWVDPLTPAAASKQPVPPLAHARASRYDYQPGLFVSEKDFAWWMIAHNVTVCDLGAGTSGVLLKGEVHPRIGRDDCGGLHRSHRHRDRLRQHRRHQKRPSDSVSDSDSAVPVLGNC